MALNDNPLIKLHPILQDIYSDLINRFGLVQSNLTDSQTLITGLQNDILALKSGIPTTTPVVTTPTNTTPVVTAPTTTIPTTGLSFTTYTDAFPSSAWVTPSTTYATALRPYSVPTTGWEGKAYYHNGNKTLNADGVFVISGRKFKADGIDSCLIIDVDSPVVIDNCDFSGTPYQGYLVIRSPDITVKNSRCFGQPIPNGTDYSPGVFLDCDNGNSTITKFIAENNYVTGCAGIRLQNITKNDNQFIIRRNEFRNINTVKGTGYRDFKSSIQLLNCSSIWCDIYQNQVINKEDLGNGEDQFNFYSCVATALKPITVHHNYIEGALSNDLSSGNNGFTGTGMTTDLSGGGKLVPQYVYIYSNQVVKTANAAINIAGGNNIYVYHNRMVTFGKLVDGRTIGQQSAATAIFDYYNSGTANFHHNYAVNNLIGYYTWYEDRRDGSTNALAADGKLLASDNLHLPNPITLASEAYERQLWEQRKADWLTADSNFSIGNKIAA